MNHNKIKSRQHNHSDRVVSSFSKLSVADDEPHMKENSRSQRKHHDDDRYREMSKKSTVQSSRHTYEIGSRRFEEKSDSGSFSEERSDDADCKATKYTDAESLSNCSDSQSRGRGHHRENSKSSKRNNNKYDSNYHYNKTQNRNEYLGGYNQKKTNNYRSVGKENRDEVNNRRSGKEYFHDNRERSDRGAKSRNFYNSGSREFHAKRYERKPDSETEYDNNYERRSASKAYRRQERNYRKTMDSDNASDEEGFSYKGKVDNHSSTRNQLSHGNENEDDTTFDKCIERRQNDGIPTKMAPVTYIPPQLNETEDVIFSRGNTQGINFEKYENVKVTVTGVDAPTPFQTFADIGLTDQIYSNVRKSGYKKPTPVQKYAISIILQHRDLMACAQTGSGKTAAFIVPIFDQLLRNEIKGLRNGKACCPVVLVILPTRELAIQTYAECRRFAFNTPLRILNLYGGVAVRYQIQSLRSGCDVLVGTVGRLLDIIRKGFISLNLCRYLVLDEADRMLDMGFEGDIRDILALGKIDTKRNTFMFSATFPSEVQSLAQDFLRSDYLFLVIGVIGGACADVQQSIISVTQDDKRSHLKKILSEVGRAKTLIFVGQKRFADFLASDLNQAGFSATSIHGDRMQEEREEALSSFISGKCPYMVATNVAARGLDIPNVDHVVNFDLPQDITEYVHRIGRTGRCGNIGKATSFFDPSNIEHRRLAPALVRVLTDAKQEVPDFLSSANQDDAETFNQCSDIRQGEHGERSPFDDRKSKQAHEDDSESWD